MVCVDGTGAIVTVSNLHLPALGLSGCHSDKRRRGLHHSTGHAWPHTQRTGHAWPHTQEGGWAELVVSE